MENNDCLGGILKEKIDELQIKNIVRINSNTDEEISKILTAKANVTVENKQINEKELKFDGEVCYDFLVVLASGEIKSISESSKFNQTIQCEGVHGEISIIPNIIDLRSNGKESDEFTYSTTIQFEVYKLEKNTDLSIATASEDVFTKEKEVYFNKLIQSVCYESSVSIDLIKDSKVNKILFVQNFATIKSLIPSTDYFVVAGEIYSFIVYKTEDGEIRSLFKESSFSEEIEAKGCDKESNIQANIFVKKSVINENSENSRFEISIPFVIFAEVYNKEMTNCVFDAYSVKNEIKLTTESLTQSEFISTKQTQDNILSSFTLGDDVPQIDKILAVTPINIANINKVIKNEEVLLEGIASLNIVYYWQDEDANDVLNSLDVEVPYSLSIKTPEIKEGDEVQTDIVFGDINIKNRRGKELEILAEVKINYNVSSKIILPITTDISIGEEKPLKDYSLEIYIAKPNEPLWDIAKRLNISVVELMNQNNNLTLPLSGGEKIVAYSQREVDLK